MAAEDTQRLPGRRFFFKSNSKKKIMFIYPEN